MATSNAAFVRSVLTGGLVAGTLDAVAAILVYRPDPVLMFRYIASGAVGPAAFGGGVVMLKAPLS